jgi:hypothetical protein
MPKAKVLIGLAATSALFPALVATASANFVIRPGGGVIYKAVGESTTVEIENTGAAAEAPTKLEAAETNNENGGGEKYIVIEGIPFNKCRGVLAPGVPCKFPVKYELERPNNKPIAKVTLTLEPPAAPCPNMRFYA